MVEKQEKLSVTDLLADTDLSPRDLSLIFGLAERVKPRRTPMPRRFWANNWR